MGSNPRIEEISSAHIPPIDKVALRKSMVKWGGSGTDTTEVTHVAIDDLVSEEYFLRKLAAAPDLIHTPSHQAIYRPDQILIDICCQSLQHFLY